MYRKFTGGHVGATVGLSFFLAATAVAVVVIDRQLVTGVLNPATALGVGFRPDAQVYLAYFFGPVVGAVVGMNLYKMFFSDDKVVSVTAGAAKPAVTTSVKAKAPAKRKTTKRKVATKK
jgi:hypothetical protein